MKRINLYSFYLTGACIAPLKLVGWMEPDAAFTVLSEAKKQIKRLEEEQLSFFQVVKPYIEALARQIDEVIEISSSGNFNINSHDGGRTERSLVKSVEDLEKILEAETPTECSYIVEQLRGFSMSILVSEADRNLSEATTKVVGSEAARDIKEAGRCLAFELPTAAGIHMVRAFDKVLRKFYRGATGKDAGRRDIWHLLDDLKSVPTVDPKVLGVLDQIRNLHRNPLAHEVFLTMDEAVEIFDIAKSAITAMARYPLL